ncbi:Rcy1p [Sporobolomyces salmoneus]|uniref:Rcy1p n=1 Tax=Sporobolomyces salmoneus TaxID=183962 RepID=UPI003175F714
MERWTALLPDRVTTNPNPHHPHHPRPRKIGRLTEPVYLTILQFLPIPDLPQFALASRKFSQLVRDDSVWRVKLGWLEYKGPGQVDWKKGKSAQQQTRQDSPPPSVAKTVNTPRKVESTIESDEEFGDFFQGEEGAQEDEGGTDDGFGDFQDGDFQNGTTQAGDTSIDIFGLSDGFDAVQLDQPPPSTTGKKPPKAADDLLLMFDDEDEADLIAPPPPPTTNRSKRPPAVTNLTFTTQPVLPSPPISAHSTSSTTRPSAFSFNSSTPTSPATPSAQNDYLSIYKTYHSTLLPYYTSLQTHTTSSLVFTTSSLSPMSRAQLLSTLSRFCHPLLAPTRSLPQRMTVLRNVQSAIDFFESTLVADFEKSDQARDEGNMREKAKVLWELNKGNSLSQIFVQKREEVFFEREFDPLQNLTKIETPSGGQADAIDFSSMDSYMSSVLSILSREGSLIARVFPPESDVLLYFLDRLSNDVVSEYITTLLSAAQGLQHPLFLLATSATFGQVYRLVETVLEIEPKNEKFVTKERAEDVVFKMFEPLMDDYLLEEGEWVREVLEGMCQEWDRKTASDLATSDPTFLASSNPAQVKKNVLAGFTKVLLLPVTIIPKTASYGLNAITYGATGAFNTFASLGGGGTTNAAKGNSTVSTPTVETPSFTSAPLESTASAWDEGGGTAPRLSIDATGTVGLATDQSSATPITRTPTNSHFDRMQLLLSLDVALQLIQADRDCLKRIQTFIRYPGTYGRKVRDAIEEVFIVLLQVLGEKHVVPAFRNAIKQMESYKPEEHADTEEVAPLVQFFELVHIGDTIQQMVDVYFEKEMANYIDKKDFLNTVVREKKKFESSLDDAVAQGLNAAVNILMTHIDWVLTSSQGPTDFCPDENVDLDLKPTKTAKEVVGNLKRHCDMLKGSTDKHILEVFNQEVGIRLHGILLKNLKRLIISHKGGLQLIADLNAYHSFVTTLRQPQITAYFTSLKMVAEIYIVEDPKDLGALVRDTSRYEGTLSPDDLYELVQRRADWRKIERQVEKQLFGLKLADDCIIQ